MHDDATATSPRRFVVPPADHADAVSTPVNRSDKRAHNAITATGDNNDNASGTAAVRADAARAGSSTHVDACCSAS